MSKNDIKDILKLFLKNIEQTFVFVLLFGGVSGLTIAMVGFFADRLGTWPSVIITACLVVAASAAASTYIDSKGKDDNRPQS